MELSGDLCRFCQRLFTLQRRLTVNVPPNLAVFDAAFGGTFSLIPRAILVTACIMIPVERRSKPLSTPELWPVCAPCIEQRGEVNVFGCGLN